MCVSGYVSKCNLEMLSKCFSFALVPHLPDTLLSCYLIDHNAIHTNLGLTNIMLHIADRERRRGQFKTQSIQVMHHYGVTEALPLQEALGHLTPMHWHQNLIATLEQPRHTNQLQVLSGRCKFQSRTT